MATVRRKAPTKAEQTKLFERFQSGDDTARDEIILRNMGLVWEIARRYRCVGLQRRDLVSEGTVGLISAVDRFDVSLGCFSTYAWCAISRHIILAIQRTGRLIRIPVRSDRMYRWYWSERFRGVRLDLSVEEQQYVWAVERCRRLKRLIRRETAEDPFVPEGWIAGGEPVDTGEPTADDLRESLNELLGLCDDRESFILMSRCGVDGTPKTLDSLGRFFDVTKERIRQIEARALDKIRDKGQWMMARAEDRLL